jgi:hypothetical protein
MSQGPVDFSRDIRPILSDHCFQCHGPDESKREGGLRLDSLEELKADRGGYAVVVPGDPESSVLLARITHADPSERMPPVGSERDLAKQQIKLLQDWVRQGADWQQHWSFIPPVRPDRPAVKMTDWPRNPIDWFVLMRLEGEGLKPSARADKETLVRRVTFDLTGLPPTLDEIDAFLADNSPGTYQSLVDRLLESPRYGERMAMQWLDAARYADTHGYSLDRRRVMWPWRDWVIWAYNQNMPFDQFMTEQLAGDLRRNATTSQKVATGFNRNHPIQSEGGAINEEYRVETVVDRVETTASVFLGLTLGCCRCHDHKYEPFSQEEFYRFYAFFNNVPESAHVGNLDQATDGPVVTAPSVLHPSESPELQQPSKEGDDLQANRPTVMVMSEMDPPRKTFVLNRGQYDSPGDVEVTAGLPSVLGTLPSESTTDRLALAEWLASPQNPLTARVTVNRYWQLHFGIGLVKTLEDFGSQGEWPSHPQLLDWLASEFVGSGWDVKAMHKLIVMSATYQQSSHWLLKSTSDPDNRFLARGPRLRLDAEMIRDQALAISGLLVEQLGGESVRPYQPPGLWGDVVYENVPRFTQDHGHKLYRRSMYTYWKRSVPPPNFQAFDAPTREACTLKRSTTNTPLAALVLMNDPTFVEASRKLAERVLAWSEKRQEERLALMFRLVTGRWPVVAEQRQLRETLEDLLADFQRDVPAAQQLMGIGESPYDKTLDVAELAAYTAIANALLQIDETITRN